MQTDFDIAICGAGPVGLGLAAMLIHRGMRAQGVALIDAKTAEQSTRDPRSIALSWGSRQLLEQLHAWPASFTSIEQIHVSRRGRFGRTLIDKNNYGLPALGYVLRYGAIVSKLTASLEHSGIHILRPASIVDIAEHNGAHITLQDRPSITANLVIQAEGGLFADQQPKQLHRMYEQTAIVAHVHADMPIAHRAFERFCDEGPLALLPQEDGYALVWCVHPDTARRLLALDDKKFLAELSDAFGGRLGNFIDVSARNAFPLGLNAQPSDKSRVIAIGNASQTLHPVAGQGLNLGLRDASVLARLLTSGLATAEVVAQFAQSRNDDRNLTIHLTDIMARIFTSRHHDSPTQTLLGLSLGLVDGFAPGKKVLADQMMFGHRT